MIDRCAEHADLRQNLSAAAHLIHGSSDGRFRIVYCTERLPEADVRSVGFDWMPYSDAVRRFNPEVLDDGINTVDGEQLYFIRNPAQGLWACRARFEQR